MSRLHEFASGIVTETHTKFGAQVAVRILPAQVVESAHSARLSESQSDVVAQQRAPGSDARQHTPLLHPPSLHCSLVVQREPSASFEMHFPPMQKASALHWPLAVQDSKHFTGAVPAGQTASAYVPHSAASMPAQEDGSVISIALHW
jgi:hypothetical protein